MSHVCVCHTIILIIELGLRLTVHRRRMELLWPLHRWHQHLPIVYCVELQLWLAEQLLLFEDHRTLHELLLFQCLTLVLLLLIHSLSVCWELAERLHIFVDDLSSVVDGRLVRFHIGHSSLSTTTLRALQTVISYGLSRCRFGRDCMNIFIRLVDLRAFDNKRCNLARHIVHLLLQLIASIQQIVTVNQ